jgi:hypothetical protein
LQAKLHRKVPERKRDKFGLKFYIEEERKLLMDPTEKPAWSTVGKLEKKEYNGPEKEPLEEGEEEDEYDEEVGSEESVEEEVRNWYQPEHEKDSHFVYVNNNRKTI